MPFYQVSDRSQIEFSGLLHEHLRYSHCTVGVHLLHDVDTLLGCVSAGTTNCEVLNRYWLCSSDRLNTRSVSAWSLLTVCTEANEFEVVHDGPVTTWNSSFSITSLTSSLSTSELILLMKLF